MNTSTIKVLTDQSALAENLNDEETILMIRCAQRILGHLKKHLDQSGDQKYQANIYLVEKMIENHQDNLDKIQGWSELKVSA